MIRHLGSPSGADQGRERASIGVISLDREDHDVYGRIY